MGLQPGDNEPRVSSHVPVTSGRYYRPELDALRFFAFLCVFCFHLMDYVHTDPVQDRWLFRLGTIGAFGVPVFFLLSAYLLTELLFREEERTGRIHILSFYMRRILRIWPLYFLVFFGLALLNRFVPGTGTDDPLAWLAFTFFAGNWYISYHGWIAGAVDPLWSISVEEQFYLAIPVVAAFGGRRAVLGMSYVLLAVAYGMVLYYGSHPVAGDNNAWTNSFIQFQFFCAGILIAFMLGGRSIALLMVARIGGFALGVACWLTATAYFKVQSWEPHATPLGAVAGWLLVLVGTLLFFLCALGTPRRFVPGWLSYLGKISYGLYLVHSLVFFAVFERAMPYIDRIFPGLGELPVIRDGTGAVAVLAISIGLAHLSYRYFEAYFLRLKRRFTFVVARD
jgi:peptidoglycan/LPS O-acetylase OafA/YrhL